jgi:hypothetical protein
VNPFDPANDPERQAIWEHLVRVDSEAFIAGDWSMIESDFDAKSFEGIRCNNSADPDRWEISFATLEGYRDSWLEASRQFRARQFAPGITARDAIFARTHLERIDIARDRALCHKKFFGDVPLVGGSLLTGRRQTLYRLHRREDSPWGWKIVGFLGQLPLEV